MLDPIVSLRRTVRMPPGSTVHVVISTMVASSREDVLELADKYRDARTFERTSTLAWTQAQVQLHHLGITAEEAACFQRLANAMLYPDAALRPSSDVLAQTNLDINTLWSQGISRRFAHRPRASSTIRTMWTSSANSSARTNIGA